MPASNAWDADFDRLPNRGVGVESCPVSFRGNSQKRRAILNPVDPAASFKKLGESGHRRSLAPLPWATVHRTSESRCPESSGARLAEPQPAAYRVHDEVDLEVAPSASLFVIGAKAFFVRRHGVSSLITEGNRVYERASTNPDRDPKCQKPANLTIV